MNDLISSKSQVARQNLFKKKKKKKEKIATIFPIKVPQALMALL